MSVPSVPLVHPAPPTASNLSPIQTFSEVQLQQMIFIYNAVMAGWTTKRVANGNFKFKKRHRSQTERRGYMQDGFLQRFMQNMQRLEAATTEEVSSFELPFDSSPPPSL
jgi:hypothetical protein